MVRRVVLLPILVSLLACVGTGAPGSVAQTQEVTVYVTNMGTKYHRDGWRHLAESRIPMRLSEAKQRYDPCKVCKPPQ